MVRNEHAGVIEDIHTLIQEKRFNNAMYHTLYNLFPTVELDKEAICNNSKLVPYLIKLYESELPKVYIKEPVIKSTYLVAVATILNNKVALLFSPESIKDIRISINLEKIALAYLRKAIMVLNKSSAQLPFERVNELNYMLNMIDLNLCIIVQADRGKMYDDNDIIRRFKIIYDRIGALILRDPKPEYCKLQSLAMHYIGDTESALQASIESVKTLYLKGNMMNLDKLQYKMKYSGKLHPVVVYE